MPRFDRTGPEGKGAKTGRGMGKCNPDNKKQPDNYLDLELRNSRRGLGKGHGLGRGLGRSHGHGRS